ncbi:hypothetical protein V1506DRAFT_539231 [Lipomyces tetrasporus]
MLTSSVFFVVGSFVLSWSHANIYIIGKKFYKIIADCRKLYAYKVEVHEASEPRYNDPRSPIFCRNSENWRKISSL